MSGRRFFLLFLFLLGSLVLYPQAETSAAGEYVFRVLSSAVILLSVYAVGFRGKLLLIAVVLAIPALLHRVLLWRAYAGALPVANGLLSLGFDVFVAVVIFRRVFRPHRATSETVFGALCLYLLIGFSFASLYGIVAAVQPHSFYLDPVTNTHAAPNRFDFIYYSFGTMSALGAAGITAVSNEARSLSVIEAILGVLYLAVLISRLMGAYRHREDA